MSHYYIQIIHFHCQSLTTLIFTLFSTAKKYKFRMLTACQVIQSIRPVDWGTTVDLKDAYFHIAILPKHRQFLRFAYEGKTYKYRVLPFGLSLAPRMFTKCLESAENQARLSSQRIITFNRCLLLCQLHHTVSLRQCQHLLGFMASVIPAVGPWAC